MDQSRFISISNNPIENRRNFVFRRVLNNHNININNINENYATCNFSKTKIILLLIITIILSLSNYFYNWNNNINIIMDEPRTILSLFDNNMFKMNEQKKLTSIRNLKEEKNDEINNNNNITNNSNNIILDEFEVYSKLKLLKELEIKRKIFESLDKFNYNFDWTSINPNNISSLYQVGESNNGTGKFTIRKKLNVFSNYIRITMKILEKKYIDKWIIFASDSHLEDLSYKFNNNSILEIKGKFSTTLFKGVFFDIINDDEPQFCQTKYQFKFPYTYIKPDMQNNNYTLYLENIENIGNIYLNLNNFSMTLSSSCGFNFEIRANINDNNLEKKIKSNKITIYCIIASLTGILYSIGILSIIKNIKRSENVISVINSDCLLINPIFNTFISLTNINIAMRLNCNFYPFLTMITFSVIKFIYFDFYLFTLYWAKKRNYVNPATYAKEKLRFYMIYYIVTFCSFLFVNILFSYFFIMVLCVCLWVPHIIHNIKSNNRYAYPFIYVLSTTLDKLIFPIYFRGYKGNFIGCKANEFLIISLVLFVIFTIIIYYIQIFNNPRFMFSESYQKSEFNFYKTKQELLSIKSDIGLEECVICLSPIFDIEKDSSNNEMIEMEDKSEKKDQIQNEEKLDELDTENNTTVQTINNIEEENEEKIIINIKEEKKDKNIIENNINNNNSNNSIFKKMWNIIKILFTKNFFYFYKKNSLILNGELYMYTPCSHVFHTECLEKWFEFKKECPNCRISMKEYLE